MQAARRLEETRLLPADDDSRRCRRRGPARRRRERRGATERGERAQAAERTTLRDGFQNWFPNPSRKAPPPELYLSPRDG
jgi:hypothetical protein